MTSCGVCGGTIRTGEKTYTARLNFTESETTSVCADCINKYHLTHRT